MTFESFISKRYLISKHKINFITIISLISIGGITIGVAALIVVLSVFNGFGSLVTSFLKNFDPDIRVELTSPEGFNLENKTGGIIAGIPGIKDFAPYVSGKVLAYKGGLTQVVNLKGIDLKKGNSIYNIVNIVKKTAIFFGVSQVVTKFSTAVILLPPFQLSLALFQQVLAQPISRSLCQLLSLLHDLRPCMVFQPSPLHCTIC